MPDDVIVMTQSETDTIIAIPKREQTAEEIERTKSFAAQVRNLLFFYFDKLTDNVYIF